jgi:hypothetical protein
MSLAAASTLVGVGALGAVLDGATWAVALCAATDCLRRAVRR